MRNLIHRISFVLFVLLSTHLIVSFMAGCSGVPTWLTDAQNVLPLIESSVAAILGIVTMLSGKTLTAAEQSTLQTIFTNISTGITDLENTIKAYQSNQGATTVADIEAAANAIIANLKNFLADVTITDSATQQKIVSLAQIVLTEFESWASLIPTLAATAGANITISVPMTHAEFKHQFNAILQAKTGNEFVDEVTGSAHKL